MRQEHVPDLASLIYGTALEPGGSPLALQPIAELGGAVITSVYFLNRLATASSATKEHAEEFGTGYGSARRHNIFANAEAKHEGELITLVLSRVLNAPREDRS